MDAEMKDRIRNQLRLRQTGDEKIGKWHQVANTHKRIWGDVSGIWGDVSGIWGDVSKIEGDVSGIWSDTSEIIKVLQIT